MNQTNTIDLESIMKNMIKPVEIHDNLQNIPTKTINLQNNITPTQNIAPLTQIQTVTPQSHDISQALSTDTTTLLDNIFSKSNIVLLSWFLTIYFFIYIILSALLYRNKPKPQEGFLSSLTGSETKSESFTNIPSMNIFSGEANTSRTIDFTVLIVTLISCGVYYSSLNDYDKTHLLEYVIKWCYEDLNEPSSIFVFSLILIGFYLLVYLLRIPMSSENKPFSIEIIESKLWIWLIMIIIVDFFKYVLGISILDSIANWFSGIWNGDLSLNVVNVGSGVNNLFTNHSETTTPNPYHNILIDDGHDFKIIDQPSVTPTVTPNGLTTTKPGLTGSGITYAPIGTKSEVYNLSDNAYTYDDAQAVCKALGGKLATYKQVEDSYNDGGEWCNYGWSDNQMALFPTQMETWNKLQQTDKYKNNCGRPGVNGGYMANKDLLFGVNCYGIKPSQTDADKALMKLKADSIDSLQPKKKIDTELDKKVKYWKDKSDTLLINSFNSKKWSEY